MSCVHCSPEDAVCVHMDIHSKKTIGMHWGTFTLTDEPILEPPERLATELKRLGLSEDAFTTLTIGETITRPIGTASP